MSDNVLAMSYCKGGSLRTGSVCTKVARASASSKFQQNHICMLNI